jgi:hypothetical protein
VGRRSFLPAFLLTSPLALAATLAPACSTQAPLVAQGGQCTLATDCQDGLICAPQKKGSNACPCVCTNDLSGVQQLPPAGDAATAAGTKDAGATRDDASAAGGEDAGASPEDAGSQAMPAPDASTSD